MQFWNIILYINVKGYMKIKYLSFTHKYTYSYVLWVKLDSAQLTRQNRANMESNNQVARS